MRYPTTTRLTTNLAAAALAMSAAAHAPAADWNQYRGPGRDGVSAESGWKADWANGGPRFLWKNSVTGIGCASMAISAKRLYTMGNLQVGTMEIEVSDKKKEKNAEGKDVVTEVKTMKTVPRCEDTAFCLDADTGALLWKRGWEQSLDPSGYEGGPCSTPCVEGNRAYFLGRTGRVTCLNTGDGSVVWEYMPEKPGKTMWAGISASPMIEGGLLIASSIAFHKETGKIAWTLKKGVGCGWASPTIATQGGDRQVVFFGQWSLTAVNPADGGEVWSLPWAMDNNIAVPLFFGGKVFISSRCGKAKDEQCAVFQVGGAAPQPVWKNGSLPSYYFERVMVGGHVYGCDVGKLKCVDLATGEVKWEGGGGGGQLIASDGRLLIMWGGTLVIAEASPAGYKELAKAKVVSGGHSIAPVLANGRIYCRGAGGEVACIEVGGK